MIHHRARRITAGRGVAALALAAVVAACGADAEPDSGAERLAEAEDELRDLVEAGLQPQLPPPLPDDEREVLELKLYRVQVAQRMIGEVRTAVAPIVLALMLFAVDGPADLLLTIAPVGKLATKAGELIKKGVNARRAAGRSQKLIEHMDELVQVLDPADWQTVRLASLMGDHNYQAVRAIVAERKSYALMHALVRRRAVHSEDIQWIARKVAERKLDRVDVRRFTFDADLVEDYSLHRANLSWTTLKTAVEGGALPAARRNALASKLIGLLGERAAADIVKSKAFARKYLGRDGARVRLERGVVYRGRYSLDIAAYSEDMDAVFVEVKNWSMTTWYDSAQRRKALAQLARHNDGIDDILAGAPQARTLRAKILMVRKEPFAEYFEDRIRREFEAEVEALGWKIELIPSADIPGVGDVIDSLR